MWFYKMFELQFRDILRWFLILLVVILCEQKTDSILTCDIHEDAKLFGLIDEKIITLQVNKDAAISCIKEHKYIEPTPTPDPTKIPFDEINKPKD